MTLRVLNGLIKTLDLGYTNIQNGYGNCYSNGKGGHSNGYSHGKNADSNGYSICKKMQKFPIKNAESSETAYYSNYINIEQLLETALHSMEMTFEGISINHINEYNYISYLCTIMKNECLSKFLIKITKINVFDPNFSEYLKANIPLLQTLKQLKYWYNFNQTMFLITICNLFESNKRVSAVCNKLLKIAVSATNANENVTEILIRNGINFYIDNGNELEEIDPHALYPTNMYRISSGHVVSSENSLNIEANMHLSITTTIKIVKDILKPNNKILYNIYKPFNRCIMIIDKYVNKIYNNSIKLYFDDPANNINLITLEFSGMEADKNISSVESILYELKNYGIGRNEPVLIVGGGVISDIGGFATSLYHRSTPYVMLCTSIVSGIDAGPSPRTCCDGYGYKNIFGAYHPPILTLTDRGFFKTLRTGWIRHGIAEIIKMAVVKDITLFNLLEKYGNRLINTKFGNDDNDIQFSNDCDIIIGKAMEAYVKSEYNNLWETHQCRPHAYGHTWSPGFELHSGMLHGHAVACGMGYGAYLSYYKKWINKKQLFRILALISNMELSLWHNIMNNYKLFYNVQVKIIEKRGGNLCAPVPKYNIGQCGYINQLTENEIRSTLNEYKEICYQFKRSGLGIEPHCVDVGLEKPM